MINLEPNVTNDDKKALVECITQSVEPATIQMNEVCYFVGFKPENLNLVGLDEVETQLKDKGYVWVEERKRWEKVSVVKTLDAEYDKTTGEIKVDQKK